MTNEEIRHEIELCKRNGKISYGVMIFSLLFILVYGDCVDESVSWFTMNEELDSFLSVIAEILSAILGLAIPLALNVIQMVQARNKTTTLTKDFISEPIYWAQIVLLVLNIVAIAILALFEWRWVSVFCLMLYLSSIFCLIKFILLIHKYVSRLPIYVEKKYNAEIDKFFK